MRFHLVAAVALLTGLGGLSPLAAQQPQDRPAEGQAAELRDRLEWTKRMWQKGYLSAAQVKDAEEKLKAAEAAGPAAPEKAVSAGPKWEYKVLTKDEIAELANKDLAAGLNKLGEEGWELVVVDTSYIFKRPKNSPPAGVKRRIALAEAEVEQLKDRVAWAERMAKKGYLTRQVVEAERAKLSRAEMALDEARKGRK